VSEAERPWSVDEILPLLEGVELFRGLPPEDLRRVAEIVDGLAIDSGEVLFEEGEAGDAFYIVFDGAVDILKSGGSQVEKLAVRRKGEAFGEMALLNDAPRSATARASQDTQLMVVGRDDFQILLGGDSLPVRMMQVLSRALRALDTRFAAEDRLSSTTDAPDISDMSRVIQRGMLPTSAPRLPAFDIAAGTILEEDGRGNTTWDHFTLADGRTAVVVLDVRAEGFPPAHIAGLARVALRTAAQTASGAADLLRIANGALASVHVEGVDQFVECGVIIPGDDTVGWASAGRMPAGVLGRDGTFQQLGSHGPPLGMMEGFGYGVEQVAMGSGDALLVLSGGSAGLFRGAADLVAQVQGKPAGEVVSTVHRAVRKAQGEESEEISVAYLRHH